MPMSRRSEHTKEELRELIIDATQRLVNENGARNVHAREIATAVGYTPGMLYSVFNNLNDIFRHVNLRSMEVLSGLCNEAIAEHNEPDKKLCAAVSAYMTFAEKNTHKYELLYDKQHWQGGAASESGMRVYISEFFSFLESQLAAIAPEKTTEEVQIAARAVWASVHGAVEVGQSNGFFLEAEQPSRKVIECMLSGFVANWKSSTEQG